jgi:hypothetical protein
MHRPVQVANSSFIGGSHTNKNTVPAITVGTKKKTIEIMFYGILTARVAKWQITCPIIPKVNSLTPATADGNGRKKIVKVNN